MPRIESRIRALALVAALAIVPAFAANAQQLPAARDDGQHLIRFGIAGGMVVPTADARAALRQGVAGEGYLLVNLGGFPLRINLGYQRFGMKPDTSGASSGNTQILGGVLGTQVDLLHGPVRPYVLAGVGGFDVMRALAGASSGTSASQLNLGIDGGAGLALKIGRISAFAEGRVQNVYTQKGWIDMRSIKAVPVNFGVLF